MNQKSIALFTTLLLIGASGPYACSTQSPPAPDAPKTDVAPDKGDLAPTPTDKAALPPTIGAEKPGTPPPTPGANQCQQDVGCGKSVELPKCPEGLVAIPYGDAINRRNPMMDKKVVVSGTLDGFLGCTELACPKENPCCNGCGGEMHLGGSSDRMALVDTKNPKRFECGGDETKTCCPFPRKVAVIASGTVGYDKHNEYALLDPVFCLP